MQEDSIFTKIIKGEIPCHKIYEDDKTLAFLDIHPIRPGHTLVIYKTQIVQFTDLSTTDFAQYMLTIQRIAKHIQKKTQSHRIVLRFEGFDVPHVHAHLIPCEKEGDSYLANRDLVPPNHVELAKIAKKLYFEGDI